MTSLFAKKMHAVSGLLLVALVLLILVAGLSWMRPMRWDLTENQLYTLSDGSLNLLSRLQGEPITFTFYYSDQVTRDIPSLRVYAKRVREMLQEYALQSRGQIIFNEIDPEPFSEAEDHAAASGLQGIPSGNDTIYFGLLASKTAGTGDKQEVIAFFNPQKEDALEYDISQLVYRLQQDKPLVVGVISDIPVFQHRDMRSGQVNRPKIILEQIRQLFDVRRVYDSNIKQIDEEIDLLVVIHPHLWSQSTLYAIDQFVLRGGKLLAFMDPKAEMDQSEQMLFGGNDEEGQSSSLEQLLTAWGIQYDPDKVLLDAGFAHTIPVSQYGQALPHLGVLGIRDQGFNRAEAMTAKTDQVNLASSGAMSALDGATTVFVPLMQSSAQHQLLALESYNAISNHKDLLEQFVADENKAPLTIAAYVHGPVQSAFPDGKPVLDHQEDGRTAQTDHVHLSSSTKDIAVVLVADTDILDDRMWVNVNDFYGQLVIQPWASNSDLIMNILEKLSGSVDLINVRSRGTYNRPFDRVLELERRASEKLREEESVLNQRLLETEQRLSELNEQQNAMEADGAIEMTPEHFAEIEQFQQKRFHIRKKLREVQHQLNRDIEQLGTLLKVINLMAVPVLLAALMLFLSWRRRQSHCQSH